MLDIEKFSELCWCGDGPRRWNKQTGRGILYRGRAYVVDFAAPYPKVLPPSRTTSEESSRGFTWGT